MKYGRSLQELAIELDRQAKVKKDYVATAGAMQMTAVNENFDLVIGNTPFQLNENAHRQLGLQLKIPAPYYERMRAENPGLLMANVNGWFQQSPDTRRMVRTLDGTARAILSDRYRRIDNYEVAQTVLPIISEMQGARIESCELTDSPLSSGTDTIPQCATLSSGDGCLYALSGRIFQTARGRPLRAAAPDGRYSEPWPSGDECKRIPAFPGTAGQYPC